MTPIVKLGQLLGVIVVGGVILAFANWKAINSWSIKGDLRNYARIVRRSQISLADKENLLDIIEKLEDRTNVDEQISWLDWRQHDETLRELLRLGIDQGEVRLIERELRRAAKRLEE